MNFIDFFRYYEKKPRIRPRITLFKNNNKLKNKDNPVFNWITKITLFSQVIYFICSFWQSNNINWALVLNWWFVKNNKQLQQWKLTFVWLYQRLSHFFFSLSFVGCFNDWLMIFNFLSYVVSLTVCYFYNSLFGSLSYPLLFHFNSWY